jgi:uncharacterized protein (TIGR03083 family)
MLPLIDTADLFPILHGKLIELLRSLDDREWALPTVAGAWTVKDVAAHLLDTQQRLVSRIRGEPQPANPSIRSNADLVAFINRLNRDGVARYTRLAPSELIAMLDEGARPFAEHHRSLDPLADAPFGVSWAGEERSANWFHTARELTERWHHQQQIRLAVCQPGIMTRALYHPVLDCFMRALPLTYRDAVRPDGSRARFIVDGDCGGTWDLVRHPSGWHLVEPSPAAPASETTIPQEIAGLVFTKGLRRAQAEPRVRVRGDAVLGLRVLGMIAIVA